MNNILEYKKTGSVTLPAGYPLRGRGAHRVRRGGPGRALLHAADPAGAHPRRAGRASPGPQGRQIKMQFDLYCVILIARNYGMHL